MKKNYFLRAAVLMLVLCTLMSGVFMGTGTMAKYIAAGDGLTKARVAKFSVKVVNADGDVAGAVELAQIAGDASDIPEVPKAGAPDCTRTGSKWHADAGCKADAPCKVLNTISVFSSIFDYQYKSVKGVPGTPGSPDTPTAGDYTIGDGYSVKAGDSRPNCKVGVNCYANCTSPWRGAGTADGAPDDEHLTCVLGLPCKERIKNAPISAQANCSNGSEEHKICTPGKPCLVVGLHTTCNADEPCKELAPSTQDKLVAPGTAFEGTGANKILDIWNESEVAVKIEMELVALVNICDGGDVPLQVKDPDTGNWVKLTVDANGVLADPIKFEIDPVNSQDYIELAPNQTAANKVTIKDNGFAWQWIFQGPDAVYPTGRTGAAPTPPALFTDTDIFDTALGIAARDSAIECGFVFRITATQLD